MITRFLLALSMAVLVGACAGKSNADAGLTLEQTIPLPNVKGRIDHLAIDLAHDRVFVAEIGNGSVDVIDFKLGKVIKRIEGLKEPQGLAYLPGQDEFVVSCGGEGTVRFYRGSDFALVQTIDGLDDADNIRLDPASGNIIVGYGSGAMAVIDPVTRGVLGTIPLPSHPEGFQIHPQSRRAYVNLPRSLKIAVVDLASMKVVESWSAGKALENFPMAIEPAHQAVAAGFRVPGRFMVFDSTTGQVVANDPACGEADDLFFDIRRGRYYMLCGDGHVDVFGGDEGHFRPKGRMVTKRGGRTGLFSMERDRLFIAISSEGDRGAAIEVYWPGPG